MGFVFSLQLKPNIKNKPDPPKKNSDLLLDIDDCKYETESQGFSYYKLFI